MAASRAGAVRRVHGARAAPPRAPGLHGLKAAVFSTAVRKPQLPTRFGHALLVQFGREELATQDCVTEAGIGVSVFSVGRAHRRQLESDRRRPRGGRLSRARVIHRNLSVAILSLISATCVRDSGRYLGSWRKPLSLGALKPQRGAWDTFLRRHFDDIDRQPRTS